jgi:folylpolyglutamate synthase/dihydropteroate synthase
MQQNNHLSISNYQYWFRPHTFLGNTIEAIAGEKAGITKLNVPVVIGEYTPETKAVFTAKATEKAQQSILLQIDIRKSPF